MLKKGSQNWSKKGSKNWSKKGSKIDQKKGSKMCQKMRSKINQKVGRKMMSRKMVYRLKKIVAWHNKSMTHDRRCLTHTHMINHDSWRWKVVEDHASKTNRPSGERSSGQWNGDTKKLTGRKAKDHRGSGMVIQKNLTGRQARDHTSQLLLPCFTHSLIY